MDAKEKAKQIVNKIKDDLFNKRNIKITDEDAVLCALIAVDEIIKSINPFGMFLGKDYWEEIRDYLENY
jgi:hypothetical protein